MGTRSGDGVLARQQHRAWQSVCAVRVRRAGTGDRCSGRAPFVAMMQATDLRAVHAGPRSLTALLAAVVALAFGAGLTIFGQADQPVDFSHNVLDAPAPVAGAVFGSGPALHPGDLI